MSAPDEVDLARANRAVATLLGRMNLAAHPDAVEPREGSWAVIVECATGSGWQRVGPRAGPEPLAAIDGDAEAEKTLAATWRTHLADCAYD